MLLPRCFPHIVNIAVQTILKELKDNPFFPVVECGADILADELVSYAEALNSDPVGQTRGIVGVCRASGGRRKELKCAIEDGNKSNTWGEIIRVVQLLRDCETRWSSTYNMIDRTMELYPVRLFFVIIFIQGVFADLCLCSQYKISFNDLPWPTIHTASS